MKSLEQVAMEQNYYPVHLAEVNRTQRVTATRDIFTENGLLIAPKGTPIDHAVAEKILRFSLVEPLMESIRLEKPMSPHDLGRELLLTIDFFPDARKLHKECGYHKELDYLVSSYILEPVLLQELTILRERLPVQFRKTLFCAWLSVLIASELDAPTDTVEAVFLAGLARDIGFLHINEEIVGTPRSLTTPTWRALQSHVILGSLLLKKLYGYDSAAAKAVLEHHERHDGSGYPAGMSDEQLDIGGQITGIADTIQAIRIDHFEKSGRNLKDLVPFLLMNSGALPRQVYEAVYSILKRSGLSPSCANPAGSVEALVEQLLTRGLRLREAVSHLQELDIPRYVSLEIGDRKILRIIEPVRTMTASSGVVDDEILGWLERLRNGSPDGPLSDLTGIDLMQNELRWQLTKVCRAIDHGLMGESSDDPGILGLREASGKISGCLSGLAH